MKNPPKFPQRQKGIAAILLIISLIAASMTAVEVSERVDHPHRTAEHK